MIKTKEVAPEKLPIKSPISPFKWLLILVVGLAIYMAFEKFSDFAHKKPDGTYELKEERKYQLNDKVKRMREQAETYYLLASTNGYYQCLHCPNGVFYLYQEEIWKIGTTIQGKENRYKTKYLDRMGLRYKVIYRGTLQKAQELEVIEIGRYPLKKENLQRPDKPQGQFIRYKLARPPGQNSDS